MKTENLAVVALMLLVGCGSQPPGVTVVQAPGTCEAFVGLDDAGIRKLRDADAAARSLATESSVLSELIAAIPAGAWNHGSDPAELQNDDGATVHKRVAAAFSEQIAFAGYSAWKGSRTIAIDGAGETIVVNRGKIPDFTAEDYAGTIWHELAHKAGYLHAGNARAGNECTVPHLLGDAAVSAATKAKTGQWGPLPTDVCAALRTAMEKVSPH